MLGTHRKLREFAQTDCVHKKRHVYGLTLEIIDLNYSGDAKHLRYLFQMDLDYEQRLKRLPSTQETTQH